MTAELIQQQIADLERQQRQLEIDYHRIAGAIIAYQKVLELLSQTNDLGEPDPRPYMPDLPEPAPK